MTLIVMKVMVTMVRARLSVASVPSGCVHLDQFHIFVCMESRNYFLFKFFLKSLEPGVCIITRPDTLSRISRAGWVGAVTLKKFQEKKC